MATNLFGSACERRWLAAWNRSQELYDAELQSTLTQIHMERTASSNSLVSMDGSRSSSLRSLGSIGNLGSFGELPSPELVRTLLQYPIQWPHSISSVWASRFLHCSVSLVVAHFDELIDAAARRRRSQLWINCPPWELLRWTSHRMAQVYCRAWDRFHNSGRWKPRCLQLDRVSRPDCV